MEKKLLIVMWKIVLKRAKGSMLSPSSVIKNDLTVSFSLCVALMIYEKFNICCFFVNCFVDMMVA